MCNSLCEDNMQIAYLSIEVYVPITYACANKCEYDLCNTYLLVCTANVIDWVDLPPLIFLGTWRRARPELMTATYYTQWVIACMCGQQVWGVITQFVSVWSPTRLNTVRLYRVLWCFTMYEWHVCWVHSSQMWAVRVSLVHNVWQWHVGASTVYMQAAWLDTIYAHTRKQ